MRNEAGKGLVLVVDDDARTARRLALMLREDGYLAEVATDGALAIGRLSRSPMPDAVITELWMPHADGCSVVHYARSLKADLPVIVLTGHPELVGRLKSAFPDVKVMPKPLAYAELLGCLNARCGSSETDLQPVGGEIGPSPPRRPPPPPPPPADAAEMKLRRDGG